MSIFTNEQQTLTKREVDVAELKAWGAPNKLIANRLFISERTVENHLRNIYEKSGVHSKTELAAWYFCARFCINPLLNPLLSAFFLLLVCVNEINADHDSMRRIGSKTHSSRMVKGKRNNKSEDEA